MTHYFKDNRRIKVFKMAVGESISRIAVVTFLFSLFAGLATQNSFAQTKSKSDREENLGIEYAIQYAEMTRYMVYVVGTEDDQEGNRAAFFNFEAIYAYRGEDKGRSTERFEKIGHWIASDDTTRDINERSLKDFEHDWIERYGNITDVKLLDPSKNPDDFYTPVVGFDPFALPITYTKTIGKAGASRACLDYMMPVGQMYESISKGGGVDLGVWYHGPNKDLAITVFQFDEKFGGMPTELSMRLRKKGRPGGALDKPDPYGTTEPYLKTKTSWVKHAESGFWLPTAIESEELTRNPRSYTIQLMWWIGKEVPDEVFGLDDFKKAVLKRSKAHELIDIRKETADKSQR